VSTPPSSSRARLLGIAAIVLANLLGGASYPAQKLAVEGLPPATVTCLRNLVAFVALGVLMLRRGTRLQGWGRRDLVRVSWLGTIAFAVPMWLGIVGVERSSAANASILVLLEPVTIVALAWTFLGESIGMAKLASLALGLAGALAIVLEGASLGDLFSGEHFAGNAILALHGVLWGLHTPIAKPLSARHDPLALTWLTVAVSLPILVVAAALEAPEWRSGPELWPALAWTAGLGLTVSFLAVLLWLGALRFIPASSVAGFVFLQPLTGILIGTLVLDERLSTAALVGGGLIVLGVALDVTVTARRGREQAVGGAAS
jgi:drug/metabolite transporter (DMT)-like permease